MLTLFYKPVYRTTVQGMEIELWVARRKLPHFMQADAVLVPVAPDLKMVFGIAKMIRDYGANAVQYEANKAAPLAPGQAFIGSGGRYRFKYTILAVIFDEVKRTSPDLILRAVRSAMQQARRKDVRSLIFPDMTENLLAQPTWITPEQRRATAEITARTTLDAIMACRGAVQTVKIWVWEPDNQSVYLNEIKRLETEGWDESRVLTKGTELPMTEEKTAPDWLETGRTGKMRDTSVTAVTGDFRRVQADALLLPTGTTLEPDAEPGSLNARVLSLAGKSVLDEAKAAGPLVPGGATLTGAGALTNVRHVIYLACRPARGPATEDTLWNSVQSALALADANGLKTLILPNLGAGKSDYAPEIAAPMILEAISDYIRRQFKIGKKTGIETIYILAEDNREEQAWARALDKYIPSPFAFLIESHGEEE